MKLRMPKGEPKPLDSVNRRQEARFSESFDVEVITPIFGGGVEVGKPDGEMPIRASAIRGQLRFWWRLLNRDKYGEDTQALYRAEREIWGGFGNEDNISASKVKLRVSLKKVPEPKPCATYPKKSDRTYFTTPEFQYGPSYAMFSGQGKAEKNKGETEKPYDIFPRGLTFRLEIRIQEKPYEKAVLLWEQQILPAFRWWASFGGIGARTRRGLGSLIIQGLAPVNRNEALAIGCQLMEMSEHRTDPVMAWDAAVGKLREFRQGKGIGRNPGTDKVPGRSRWPEADSIREITSCHLQTEAKTHAPENEARLAFPRAAFGLPIITHFKDGPNEGTPAHRLPRLDPGDTTLLPLCGDEAKDRLSSPLILKAMWNGKDYTPIALLLPHKHLAEIGLQLQVNPKHLAEMGLQLQVNPAKPLVDFPPGSWWCDEAQNRMTGDNKTNPLKGKTGDVLNDFLDFFKEGK